MKVVYQCIICKAVHEREADAFQCEKQGKTNKYEVGQTVKFWLPPYFLVNGYLTKERANEGFTGEVRNVAFVERSHAVVYTLAAEELQRFTYKCMHEIRECFIANLVA